MNDNPTTILMYGAPWCGDCRRAKKFFGEQRVNYEWIDIDEDETARGFIEELQNGGRTIPTIIFPDGSYLLEPSNDELANKLGLQLRPKRAFYDLVIIGGGPAGLSASIYAAREGIDTLVIERSALGGNAGVTERIDNYPGFPDGISGSELADRFIEHARRYDVELLSAVGVGTIREDGHDLEVVTDQGDAIGAHAALIATGSTYRRLGVTGEEGLIGAGVHFCATCDGPFYKGADELVVIGGGNSGLEEGVFLSQFAKKVRIIEHAPELKASALLQEKIRTHPQFEVHTNTEVIELKADRHRLAGVVTRDRTTGEEHTYNPAAAFVFIGLTPNTAFLTDIVSLDDWGFVTTDDVLQTSMPGVFAAGDVRRGSTKQLGAAVGEGIAALLHVRQYLQKKAHISRKEELSPGI
ncbi:MAG: FAD-dependent oxidoreductase [Dehalococcoidia bacterium]